MNLIPVQTTINKLGLNNILLEKYTIEDYLTGVDNLCRYYNMYDNKEVSLVKIHWMKQKYRLRLLNYIKD